MTMGNGELPVRIIDGIAVICSLALIGLAILFVAAIIYYAYVSAPWLFIIVGFGGHIYCYLRSEARIWPDVTPRWMEEMDS